MKIDELVYKYSPILIQNLLISLYGYYLFKKRYTGNYKTYYNQALERSSFSEEELNKYVVNELVSLLCNAKKNTNYYSSHLNGKNIDKNKIFEVLKELPVITKSDVINYQDDFISLHINNNALTINTSGTTGAPLNVYTSEDTLQKNYAYFARFLKSAGLSIFDKSCTFAGRVLVPSRQNGGPYWRTNYKMNTKLFSSYHISNETIPLYIDELEKYSPIYIDSYPSAIGQIASFILDNRIEHGLELKAIITSSETLTEDNRRNIENAFNCKVYDHYGCAEMAGLITECSKGNYHVNSDYGYLEILDESGNQVDYGVEGDMVFTGLINDSMPLIRYKIGDTAISSAEKCACGSSFPVLQSIMGRKDDYIIGKDGRKVGRLDPIFKGAKGIQECQVVQKSHNKIIMFVVKSSNYEQGSMNKVVSELKKRVGDTVVVDVQFVTSIPRTKSGKFRSVISEVK